MPPSRLSCSTRRVPPARVSLSPTALSSASTLSRKDGTPGTRSASYIDAASIHGETVLFEGTARDICPLFPRNVNSHAAVALAGIGFDRTRSVLIADPALEVSIIELEARGGGVEISIRRENPMAGVSGVMTLMSSLASIGRASAVQPGLRVC